MVFSAKDDVGMEGRITSADVAVEDGDLLGLGSGLSCMFERR